MTGFAGVFLEGIFAGFARDFSERIFAGFACDFPQGICASFAGTWLMESEALSLFPEVAQLPVASFDSFDSNLGAYELSILCGKLSASVAPSTFIALFLYASFGHRVRCYSFSFICFRRCFSILFVSYALLPLEGVSDSCACGYVVLLVL